MINLLFFVIAMLAVAKPLARWFADNTGRTGQDSGFIPPQDTGTPAEKKSRLLQDQVNSKVHWDAPDSEVIGWLLKKHGIEGARAEAMLTIARRTRVRAIRERSLYGMICAVIGMIGTGTPMVLQLTGGFVWVRSSMALVAAFGFCVLWFGKYLLRFLRGKTGGTVDL